WSPEPDRSGSGDGVSRERGDVQAREARARRRQRAADIDGAAGVLDDGHGKVLSPRVLGRVADTEGQSEPRDKNSRETARPEITGQSGGRLAVVLVQGGIGIDRRAKALAQHELGVGDLQTVVELGADRALDAMIRP